MAAKLIFGCGYLGGRVAQLWRKSGQGLVAATRSPAHAEEYERAGLQAFVADVTQPATLRDLPMAETVLFAVGFDRTAGGDMHTVYAGGVRNVLDALPSSTGRLIYISTTGVYGSAGGAWVNEQTPPDPQREGGRASLAAEQALAASRLGCASAVLRLAGIYGPGRVPYLDALRRGEPIAAPSRGWLNLIHVDDAARVVVAIDQWLAARREVNGPHVFCVSDGAPVIRGEYYAEAARLIGAPLPRFASPEVDSPAAARAAADRRIANDKMTRELQLRLQFPTYREGLAAILGAVGN